LESILGFHKRLKIRAQFCVFLCQYCRGIIIATSHAKHKVRVHPPTALLRMRVGVPPFHTCYPSVYLSLFQRSSRLSTEIHVQYSTACLTVWLCRICLRHNTMFQFLHQGFSHSLSFCLLSGTGSGKLSHISLVFNFGVYLCMSKVVYNVFPDMKHSRKESPGGSDLTMPYYSFC